jgi:hypothetical protein
MPTTEHRHPTISQPQRKFSGKGGCPARQNISSGGELLECVSECVCVCVLKCGLADLHRRFDYCDRLWEGTGALARATPRP